LAKDQWDTLLDEAEMENLGKIDKRTQQEIEEDQDRKEAKSREEVLEMLGDIPDAGVKPPDNVLFICKLNPVTTAEDLEIIFSRFGEVIKSEVIKDWKTGDSLCYAFVEFATHEECEAAYMKMDNVLIDDRRVHVDFSQSVSKQCVSKDGRLVRVMTHNFMGVRGRSLAPQFKEDFSHGGKVQLKDKHQPQHQRGGAPAGKYSLVFDEEDNNSSSKKRKNTHDDDNKNQKPRDDRKSSSHHSDNSHSSSTNRSNTNNSSRRDDRREERHHKDTSSATTRHGEHRSSSSHKS